MKQSRRKPLSEQKGHITKDKIEQLKQEEEAVKTKTDELIKPPTWLSDSIARKEWRRIVPQLLEINVIGNLDISNVGGYCNAYSAYVRATNELKKMPLIYRDPKDGKTKENPYIKLQTQYAVEMRRFADMCGMSVSSRLKAAATETAKTDRMIGDVFGDI